MIKGRRWMFAFAAGVGLGTLLAPVTIGRDPSPESLVNRTTELPRAGAGTTPVPYAQARLLGYLENHEVQESSGLAASRTNPGLLWTHNDSGDEPFIFCVELDASSCGTWRVEGADAIDWEDMAAGPGPDADTSYLYLGDIGDNERARAQIQVYRVTEPRVTQQAQRTTRADALETAPAETITLSYPTKPHDAEALLVHPVTGDLYVVTKFSRAGSVIFRAAAPLGAGETLERIGRIRDSKGFSDAVTGGDIAPDGTRIAFSTYGGAIEYALGDGADFDTFWKTRPIDVSIGRRLQGEAIAYRLDGRALLATSELVPAPLYEALRRD